MKTKTKKPREPLRLFAAVSVGLSGQTCYSTINSQRAYVQCFLGPGEEVAELREVLPPRKRRSKTK